VQKPNVQTASCCLLINLFWQVHAFALDKMHTDELIIKQPGMTSSFGRTPQQDRQIRRASTILGPVVFWGQRWTPFIHVGVQVQGIVTR